MSNISPKFLGPQWNHLTPLRGGGHWPRKEKSGGRAHNKKCILEHTRAPKYIEEKTISWNAWIIIEDGF